MTTAFLTEAAHTTKFGTASLSILITWSVLSALFWSRVKIKSMPGSCLLLYLGQLGVEYPENQTPQQLLKHLCDPPHSSPGHVPHTRDYIKRGFSAITDLLISKRLIDHNVQRCAHEDMLRQAVRWFFTAAGNFDSNVTLPPEIAIHAAEKRLKISVDEYLSFATACQNRHPWTVAMARGTEKPTGISIILPLREEIYMKVRNGELTSFRCDPNDFEPSSRHLLLEVVSQRPLSMKGESTENSTKSLLWCVFSQIAVLSRFSSADDKSLHLLAIDGAADTKERLDAYGFKATGARMPETNEKLYERVISPRLKGPGSASFINPDPAVRVD